MAVAASSVVLTLLQNLSVLAIVQLSLLLIGIIFSCYDTVRLGHGRLREYMRRQLDATVWDNALYNFFHPNYDWYTFLTETMLGQVWIYILPLTASQRVRLLQASLGVDEQEAQNILFAPGGYKNMLLPDSVLNWLEGEKKNGANEIAVSSDKVTDDYAEVTTSADVDAESSTSSEGISPTAADCTTDEVHSSRLGSEVGVLKESSTEENVKRTQSVNRKDCTPRKTQLQEPPSLRATIASIFLEYVVQGQLSPALGYMPEPRHIKTAGIAAATALALQLRCSRRARGIVLSILEASSVAGLTAVTMGAASILLAKRKIPHETFHVNERNLCSHVSNVLQWRQHLLDLFSSSENNNNNKKRWKIIFYAAFGLMGLAVERRRQQRLRSGS